MGTEKIGRIRTKELLYAFEKRLLKFFLLFILHLCYSHPTLTPRDNLIHAFDHTRNCIEAKMQFREVAHSTCKRNQSSLLCYKYPTILSPRSHFTGQKALLLTFTLLLESTVLEPSMARDKVSGKEKIILAAARFRKHRTRRCRDFRTHVPQDTDASLVNPFVASSSSAPQPIFNDRFLFRVHLELFLEIWHYFLRINPISCRSWPFWNWIWSSRPKSFSRIIVEALFSPQCWCWRFECRSKTKEVKA